jgi:hypothetical protein
LSLTTDWSQIR